MHWLIKKKREKQFNEAFDIWQEVATGGNEQQRMEASIECAKLLEHQFKEVGAS